ncbi:MAG: phosphoribosyl-ATP diphosphatase [Granulosicoccaceae bacterium]
MTNDPVLSRIAAQIEARKQANAENSYVAGLFAAGEDAILQKVGEESIEFLLAAKSNDTKHLVAEAADVWFHMLVLMSHKGLGPDDILKELNSREGVSGLAEYAARGND